MYLPFHPNSVLLLSRLALIFTCTDLKYMDSVFKLMHLLVRTCILRAVSVWFSRYVKSARQCSSTCYTLLVWRLSFRRKMKTTSHLLSQCFDTFWEELTLYWVSVGVELVGGRYESVFVWFRSVLSDAMTVIE